ncbi:uncharacterized protein LOC103317706 [Nasonia vitripennis]|uniref:Uncharacterized protein n=1 Tax=Nasonia vitripennis TaxID=7425 RepID=A0A7M7QU32_NASVI|nr:uncharacterized protein LOC103317706 [Nasonia vitripennis]
MKDRSRSSYFSIQPLMYLLCFDAVGKLNRFLCIAVFVFAFEVAKQVNAKNLEPQIEGTHIHVDGLNPKYMQRVSFAVKKHNATYKYLPTTWIFVQDLPPVTNAKLLLTKHVPICSESPYRELLPKPLVTPEAMLQDSCLKKGKWENDDFGIFRFEVLIPNIHEISDYYSINYKYITDDSKELVAAE